MIVFEQIKRQLGTGDKWGAILTRPKRTLPSRSKAHKLLEVLPTTHFVFVSDIHKVCELEKSTIQKHLKDLHLAGKVERGPDIVKRGATYSQWRKIE